ncbi:hypothetical protein BTZ20_2295 [Rhodococcus sp. MTM3W5.2]|nr:hypothetical protein BTZ20_2295 [Rhodococcus sp. MTM3W5.2]
MHGAEGQGEPERVLTDDRTERKSRFGPGTSLCHSAFPFTPRCPRRGFGP